jgi:beta-xylosidase
VGEKGKGVVTYRKPNVGKTYPIKKWFNSDEFNNKTLGLQWGWNHNPDSTNWALTNEGTLRLTTSKVVTSLPEARNTLTQRIFSYYNNTPTIATTKLTTKNMLEGDVAGLAVFQDPYAFIGVKIINGKSYVMMNNNSKTIDSVLINKPIVYLRAEALFNTNKSTFSYSTDNKRFYRLGNELNMQFNLSVFTGNKFCLFNYPTKSVGGIVDFDWFRTNEISK